MVLFRGESRIRTCEDVISGFTVRPRWPLEYLPKPCFEVANITSVFSVANKIKTNFTLFFQLPENELHKKIS
jgi:hypothetical protein